MKNIIKNLIFYSIFIVLLLILNFNIKALDGTKSTFDNKNNTINTFYNVFNDYNDTYLKSGPFICLLSNNKIKCTGKATASSISKLEYEIIGSNSYLTSKESYWLNDSKDTNIAYTVDIKINEVTKSSLNSSRASVYIQDNVTYSGSGTRIDPFTLNEPESESNAQDINLIAFYIDANGDGNYTGNEESPVSFVPAEGNYALDTNKTKCLDIDGLEHNVRYTNSDKTISIVNATKQINCTIGLRKINKDYLANAPEGYYIRNGISYNTSTNTFIGRYVTMDSSICNSSGQCGVIPNPSNNSAISNPANGCSAINTGEQKDGTSVGNCDVTSTYCAAYMPNNNYFSNWRIIYVEGLYNDLTVEDFSQETKQTTAIFYITTAKSPECVAFSSNASTTISNLNASAKKYCNNSIIYNEVCSSSNVWALKGEDYNKFSIQTLGTFNLQSAPVFPSVDAKIRVSLSNWESEATKNNLISLINNYESYAFANAYSSTAIYNWTDNIYGYNYLADNGPFGVRPVLKLKAGIKYTGGVGTSSDPYRIIP